MSPVVGGITFGGSPHFESAPLFGLRAGYNFTRYLGAEALLDFARTRSTLAEHSVGFYRYGAELLLHAWPEHRFVPYAAAGVAAMSLGQTKGAFDLGAGFKYFVTEDMAWRADVRGMFSSLNRPALEYTTGIYIPFGGAPDAVRLADAPAPPEPAPRVMAPPPRLDLGPPPAPVAPPVPVPVPVPEVVLSASPASIARGETSILSWQTRRAESCEMRPAIGAVPTDGTLAVTPESDTLYALTCRGKGGSAGSSATVVVAQPGPAVAAGPTPEQRFCDKPALIVINFDVNRFDVKPRYHQELKTVGDFLNDFPQAHGEISGHTDSTHTKRYNQKLSEQRANSVRQYIVDNFGIDPSRLTSKGYGQTKPIASNKTAAGRAKNRRIEANLVCDKDDNATPVPVSAPASVSAPAPVSPTPTAPVSATAPVSEPAPTPALPPATPPPRETALAIPGATVPAEPGNSPQPPEAQRDRAVGSAPSPLPLAGATREPLPEQLPQAQRAWEPLPVQLPRPPVAEQEAAAAPSPLPTAQRKQDPSPSYFPWAVATEQSQAAAAPSPLPVAQRKQEPSPMQLPLAPVAEQHEDAAALSAVPPAQTTQEAGTSQPPGTPVAEQHEAEAAPSPLPAVQAKQELTPTQSPQVPEAEQQQEAATPSAVPPAPTKREAATRHLPWTPVAEEQEPATQSPLPLAQRKPEPVPAPAASALSGTGELAAVAVPDPVAAEMAAAPDAPPLASALRKQEPEPAAVDEEPFVLAADKPRAAPHGKVTLTGITIDKDGLSLITDGKVNEFRMITLVEPYSLVIDLFGAVNGMDAMRARVDKFDLLTVRIKAFPEYLQIIVDADREEIIPYRSMRTDTGLRINIKPRSSHHIGP